jgi:hypothetical protein
MIELPSTIFPGSKFTGCPPVPKTSAPAGAVVGLLTGEGLLLVWFVDGLLQFDRTIAKAKATTAMKIDRD